MNELVRSHGNGVGIDVYQWGTVDVVVVDTAALAFPDESFDSVSIVAALNHIPNRADVLREAHRVLRADGRLIVTMIPPCLSRVWHFVRKPWDVDQKERRMKSEEVYGLTREEMRGLLEGSGFEVLLEKPFMLRANCLTVARKCA